MNSMEPTRRDILIAASLGTAGLIFNGCQNTQTAYSGMPGVPWPKSSSHPRPNGNGYTPKPSNTSAQASSGMADLIVRSQWTNAKPRLSNINAMNGISRITIHHEGIPKMPVTFSDFNRTKARLEMVRNSHVNYRGWSDIGYHYIVDRAGRVWEGRPLKYQGAHVKNKNEHNIGIMCLGNFEIQNPSDAQLAGLQRTITILRRKYNVQQRNIHTHRELGPTSCPGRSMQPKIDIMRRMRKFA